MKTIFLFIFLFVINLCTAQMQPIIIVFKTGDTIRGVGKIKGKSVKYKDELNEGEPKEFEFSEIEIVKLVVPQNKSVNYKFFKIKEDSEYLPFVEEMSGAKVSLYTTTSSSPSLSSPTGVNLVFVNNIKNYYAKRKTEEFPTLLGKYGTINNFKDKVLNYFDDCEKLVDKIKNKNLRVKHGLGMPEIIEFYNANCAN